MIFIFRVDPVCFYLVHILAWFICDWILIHIVQVIAGNTTHTEMPNSTRLNPLPLRIVTPAFNVIHQFKPDSMSVSQQL